MKVLLYTDAIDNLYNKRGTIGGIAIQMSFWANTFHKRGWDVFSITHTKTWEGNGIKFLYIPNVRYINIILEYIYILFFAITKRPDIIIYRGSDRKILPLLMFARLIGSKFVFFAASDTDFEIGKEIIPHERDRKLYRFAMKKVRYAVVQNEKQAREMIENYGEKRYRIIPNIWVNHSTTDKNCVESDFLWVSNIKSLKRPIWFIELAKRLPQYRFVMAGGVGLGADELYEECRKEAESQHNIEFLGNVPFEKVNEMFAHTKCFVCTSEFEGFPNTFLQAWSNGVPVISTVSPSDLLEKKGLGIEVHNEKELENAAKSIFNDTDLYAKLNENIKSYFDEAHSPENAFESLLNLLKEK